MMFSDDGAQQKPLLSHHLSGPHTSYRGRNHEWLLHGLYATAVGLRFLPFLQRVRQFPRTRQYLAVARGTLTTIGPEIKPVPNVAPPASWVIQRLLPTASEVTVLLLGPRGRPAAAVLKLPRTGAAIASLEKQDRMLAALQASEQLGAWRRLLPPMLAAGTARDQVYSVEQLLPGRDARSVLSRPETRSRMETAAAAAIGELHRRTARRVLVDGEKVRQWTHHELQALRATVAQLPQGARYDQAIERLMAELHEAFVGRTLSLSTVHGDYFPGNILVTPDGATVTGIVDWDHAEADGLPLLDLLLLLLSTRMLVQHKELGEVVGSALTGRGWTPHEHTLLKTALAELPGDAVAMRAMILLCWLKHVGANLMKSTWYGGHRLWVAHNIERVLQCL